MGEGEYVLGLEPCNCFVGGRKDANESGKLEYLMPGESRNFELIIGVIGRDAGDHSIVKKISGL